MSSKILILGKGGQVGSALAALLGDAALVASIENVDFLSPDIAKQLSNFTAGHDVYAVINAAAYTQVDKAEGEGRQASARINAEAVGELASWCASKTMPLVHYSTDYVFDGSGDVPRTEDVRPAPLNQYGKDKLAGEVAIIASGCKHLIFRTSWVYDAYGVNFFNTMLRLFRERESLNIVSDQIGAPTYAPHLAKATMDALSAALAMPQFPSGIYHLCGAGETNWHEFAQTILKYAQHHESAILCNAVYPIPSSSYPTPAKRPLNSRLDCNKAKKVFGMSLPDWHEGLAACIKEKYGHKALRH
ncbi:MAG: dTDP-4-dehydrorhamnose reductase [Alphaproteobacteria bacterium]